MAHEVVHAQRVPELLVGLEGLGRQRQLHQRLAPARLDLGGRVGRAATHHAQGQAIGVLQQLALPGAPHLGAGATDVGHGEQVQRRKVALVAHALGKGLDHLGVRQVLLLRDLAHGQVLAHEEFDQLGVGARNAVGAAKTLGLHGADDGVVAAPALADVVEQRGHVQQPGLVPAAGQLGAERVLMRMLGHEKAPHIAQHHEDVLVHRVDVEQVMLHLAHDAPEGPQVAPQHRGLVHQPHGVRDAAGLLQDLHEGGAVDRVAPEGRIHQVPRAVQRAQRARRQVGEAHMGLVHQKGFEDGVRLALVEIVAGHLDGAGLLVEARVQPDARRGARVQPLLDVQPQYLAQLGHGLGRPVVVAHQRLAGAHGQLAPFGRGGAVAKGLGHGGLLVENQAVLVPARHGVQARAYQAEHGLVVFELLALEIGDQSLFRQGLPAVAQACGAGQPDHGVQIAQAAGRFLAVGLQRVGRALVLVVALAHFQQLAGQKGARIHLCLVALLELAEQRLVSADAARLQQGGLHGEVAPGLLQAFGQRAHAGADLQARVPAAADELFYARGQLRVCRAGGRQQHQHVDVGVGKQLGAAIASHGGQAGLGRHAGAVPQRAQQRVGQIAQVLQHQAHAAPAHGGRQQRAYPASAIEGVLRAQLLQRIRGCGRRVGRSVVSDLFHARPGQGRRLERVPRAQCHFACASRKKHAEPQQLVAVTKGGSAGEPADRVMTS